MLLITGIFGALLFMLQSQILVFESVRSTPNETAQTPFPVSVDPSTKTINSNDAVVNQFYSETLARNPQSENRWYNQVASVMSDRDWYQNLASPVSRIVVIWPGDRKEEVASHIGKILRWSREEREEFISLLTNSEPALAEGKFFPGQYVTHRYATPQEVYQLVHDSFTSEILNRYTEDVAERVPLEDALIIASLIEREASDFNNMREVSGVIWNRLFIDMPLQLDATLQYIRGSYAYEPVWWPVPRPQDKFLSSPFNTYQNEGLPPTPIANPSSEAVLAALNPIETDCLFYFHRNNGEYHCSATYNEHVSKLRGFYGRGR
jgi:cell division protein YceG involved in septum cleavage